MSGKLFSGLCAAALGCSALGQTSTFYENSGVFLAPPRIPPNIDAVNFLNSGQFVINFTNNDTIPIVPPPAGLPPYETQNTVNYSNLSGLMSCNTGFRLETYNSQTSQRQRASSFFNAGTINCGTIDTTNYFVTREFFFGTTNFITLGTIAGSKMLVNASNIVNSGTINMGFESSLSIKGGSVDLTRASVISELSGVGVSSGVNINLFPNEGIFDGYWGVGDPATQRPLFYPQGIIPSLYFESNPPFTPIHPVTTRNQNLLLQTLQIPNAFTYVLDEINFATSNRTVRAVFLGNTNANIQANVYFPFLPDIIIEYTNKLAAASTNLYVFDYFLILTNLELLIHGVANNNSTLIPFNYRVFASPSLGPLLGPPAAQTGVPPGTFNSTPTTNHWSAYQALLQPLSVVLADNALQAVTNLPGRMEIIADKVLDLSRARITSLNYLSLKSTNHFAGSSRAQISSPFMDINLASTNGLLAITNLLVPTLHRAEGDIQLFSARWTNVTTDLGFALTNRYHVLFADAHFSPTSPSRIQDLVLRTGGGTDSILISDVLNVTRSLLLDARRITITTNEPGSPTATGGINVESSEIVWPASTPRLQNFTNNGFIHTLNTMFFGGSRTSPYYGSNFNEPYLSFVNSGGITNYGSLIWANYFENSGRFTTGIGSGSITLESQTALLTNGFFLASGGDISITSSVLTNINHVLQAGRKLTLNVTDVLTDTVTNTTTVTILSNLTPVTVTIVSNANSWTVGNGVDLPVKPKLGDLLGTTILDTATPGAEIRHLWAAEDRDCSPAGYSDNVALGRLILDGGNDSLFRFTPAPVALTFDDAALQFIPPAGSPVRSGFYKPANYAPARQMLTNGVPANTRPLLLPPFGTSLAVFRGTNSLDGVWRLFVDDRTTNNLGNFINWNWNVGVAVLSSNYTQTTTAVFINGFPVSTASIENTNYVGTRPAFAGAGIVLPAGAPSGGAVAQPYPSSVSLTNLLRSTNVVNFFGVTNQVGPNVFVTNVTERVYTTDHVTNVVVSLSAPTVPFPADLDVLLIGPHGEKVMLMAGAGALDTANRNALYVDYLELTNFVAGIDFTGDQIPAVQIDPNMKIYYAQLIVSGLGSQADRFSGANAGRFCWVSNYAGIYSSTNLFYGGGTNTLNAALVQSINLDSDCDGLVNRDDSDPIFLVTTASLPEATNNAAYSVQLLAGGGPPSPHTWALAPGSAPLPDGLGPLSTNGLISGTPTQPGLFSFTVRVSVTTDCGILTADRILSINVSPGVLALSVVLVSQPTPGALVSWPGIPNSTNYLYFKPSPQASDWLLLTNFGVGGAVTGRVSVLDPVSPNATRFYRVQVTTHQ